MDVLYVTLQLLAVAVACVYGLTLLANWICSPYADGKIRGPRE